MHAQLSLIQGEYNSTLASSEDKSVLEDTERTLSIVHELQRLLDVVFPGDEGPEITVLHHGDLSQHNIMVDEDGALTGVVDWECVSAVPLWRACNYPSFLEGKPRDRQPKRKSYWHHEDGEPDELYWEHLMEYELTVLRTHFLSTMQTIQPEWAKVYHQSQLPRDFDSAMLYSDDELSARDIKLWTQEALADSIKPKSLWNRMYCP